MNAISSVILTSNVNRRNPVRFRRAVARDALALQRLLRRAYKKPKSLGVVFPASSVTVDTVRRNIGRQKIYVLVSDGLIVGTVSIKRRNFGCEICHLAVLPKYQSRGFGNRLLDYAENIIKSLGNSNAYLFTAENHPWLASFYRRHGYKRLRVQQLKNMQLAFYKKRL